MELGNGNGNVDRNGQHGQGGPNISLSSGAGAASLSSADESGLDSGAGDNTGAGGCSEHVEPFNNNIPTFLDRTFKMIETISNDVVCWSEAGDSFIVKQAREEEEKQGRDQREAAPCTGIMIDSVGRRCVCMLSAAVVYT